MNWDGGRWVAEYSFRVTDTVLDLLPGTGMAAGVSEGHDNALSPRVLANGFTGVR